MDNLNLFLFFFFPTPGERFNLVFGENNGNLEMDILSNTVQFFYMALILVNLKHATLVIK